MCQREIEKNRISSLKIDFNNVFGYYIEVRNTHKDKVPEDWIRKQTLVNAERYITEELKGIRNANSRCWRKNFANWTSIISSGLRKCDDVYWPNSRKFKLIAELDCAVSLSELAISENYTKPILNETFAIDIKEGRHPIIEKSLPLGEKYIPNDVFG